MHTLTAAEPAPHTTGPATTPAARRRPHARLALLVGLVVLALHAVLIQHLAPASRLSSPPGARPALPVVVLVQMPVRSLPAPGLRPAPQATPQATVQPAAVLAKPAKPPATAALARAAAPPAQPLLDAKPLAATATAAAADADADADAHEDAANNTTTTTAPGSAPPLYPTQMPSPTTLRYALHHPHQAGVASLAWQHDGQRYQLQLDSRSSAGQPLLEQASHGVLDNNGLAPERFTDRRRGRAWRAANFRRDVGRISFSGPPVHYPAWPGAQDRLSWLVQLVAIQAAAAAAGQPLAPVRLFVVDARGGAALWQFEPISNTANGAPLQHWQYQPPLVDGADRFDRMDGQRVDIWLDPALGHWPVRLRYTQLRSGDQTEWLHLPGPAQPP